MHPLSRLSLRRAYLWLSLLLAGIAAVLGIRLGRPVPEPVVMVVQGADSVTADADRYPAYDSHRYARSQRRDQWRHPILDVEETSVSSTFSLEASKKALVVELNSADTLTLQLLRGIGPTFARRIVRYRERLGGFYCVEQLREVYGMTDDRYQTLVPHLTVDTDSLRRIDINQVTVKELMRHPYVDPYLARDIIRYRDKGHPYRMVDDLRLVATMDDSTLMRLMPYLSFE